MQRLTLALVVGLLLGAPASSQAAGEWQNKCRPATTTGIPPIRGTDDGNKTIDVNTHACWVFKDADSTHFSVPFTVSAATGLVVFDSDASSTSIGAGRIKVRMCPGGAAPTASADISKVCIDLGGALSGQSTLDGTEGQDGVQNAAFPVTNGVYVIEVTTACDSDACVVYIKGELPQ